MRPFKYIIHNKDEIFGLTSRLKDYFDKNNKSLVFECSELEELKTNPQLRYLHDIISDYLVDVLFEVGNIEAKSPHLAKFWLKEYIGYGEEVRVKHKGNDYMRFIPKSFANASKSKMAEAIDAVVRVCAFAGVEVPKPNEGELMQAYEDYLKDRPA